jgi:DNA-binding CsgD family transcriptional regulator
MGYSTSLGFDVLRQLVPREVMGRTAMEKHQCTHEERLQLLGYLRDSRRATRYQVQFQLLTLMAQSFGFKFVSYEVLSGTAPAALTPTILNYPKHWQLHYDSQNYHSIDPIVLRAPATHLPLLWKTLKSDDLSVKQIRLFEEAAAAGLVDGVSIPLHGPFSRVAVISFVSPCEMQMQQTLVGALNAIAIQFDLACRSIDHHKNDRISLSNRERECLSWAAAGKSSWDISKIIGISENTVNFHIKNSMKKLDCSSRSVAIVKAIRMALINSPSL